MRGGQSGNRVEERERGWRTGRGTCGNNKGREIVYGLEESIKECKTGEKGQQGDREKRAKKGGGRGTGETGRMT